MNSREAQLAFIASEIGEGVLFTPQEVAEGSGLSRQLTNINLKRLVSDLIIEKRSRGEYMLFDRGKAIEYLANSKMVTKAVTEHDLKNLRTLNKESIERLNKRIDVAKAIRTMGFPSHSMISRYFADEIYADIEILKKVIVAIERGTVKRDEALDIVREAGMGGRVLAERLKPIWGMDPDAFRNFVLTYEERTA